MMLDRLSTLVRVGSIAALVAAGIVPAVAQEATEEVVPPQLMRQLVLLARGNEVYRENYLQNVMQEFRALAGDDQILDGSDVDLLVAASSASYRAAIVQRVMSHDLDADGAVTEEELQRVNAVLPRQFGGNLDDLVRGYLAADGNGDRHITAAEANVFAGARELPDRTPGVHRAATARQLVGLDDAGDGRLTANELDAAARKAFASFDLDGDGRLIGAESQPLQNELNQLLLRPDGVSAKCQFPKLSGDAQLVVMSAANSDTLSDVTVAGPDQTTDAQKVLVRDGAKPIYVVAISGKPRVWDMTGSTERIEHFVATSVRIGDKRGGTGVAGLDRGKVSFVDRSCFAGGGGNLPVALLGPAVKRLAGREPDEIVVGRSSTKFRKANSSSDNAKSTVTLVPGNPKAFEDYSSRVDRETYREFLRFSPGGVADIDPATVVSEGPVEAYAVLPQQAGLVQLLDAGALERAGHMFRIVGPIERFPPGLHGAHSVTFSLAEGVPMPKGDPGHSSVMSEETVRCSSTSVHGRRTEPSTPSST